MNKMFQRVIVCFFFAMTADTSSADNLIIQGSTTFARHLFKQESKQLDNMSGHQVTVVPNKSLPGLIALIEGRAQIAMISAPLETEVAALNQAMPGLDSKNLIAHEITRVGVAIIVNRQNTMRKTGLNEIRKILTGEITNWSALGGADLPIRVVLVGGGGGVTTVVQDQLLKGQQSSASNLIYMNSPVQLVQVVEQEAGAIGFAQWELAKQRDSATIETEKSIEQILSLVTKGQPTSSELDVIKAIKAIAMTH